MKKTLLFSAALAATVVTTNAQTVSNAGFENWEGPSGTFMQTTNPTSWFGTDKLLSDNFILLQAIGVTPVAQLSKSTDAHSGSFAAELKTKFQGDTLGNVPCALVNAKLSLNIMAILADPDFSNILNAVTYIGGTPTLGKKVDSVNAWIKLTDENEDNGFVTVTALQKAKTSTGADTMIAIGEGSSVIMLGVSNNYREISVPVAYASASNTATDTLLVVFSSSTVSSPTSPTTNNNTLLVDDVSMYTSDGSTVSVKQPLFAEDIASVYPNPATNVVYFNLNTYSRAQDYTLVVTDVAGKIILNERLNEQVNAKNVSAWAKGNYFYSLTNTQNGKFEKGKFTVK